MFTNFNEEIRKTLIQAKKEMKMLKHPYVGSEHMLLGMLKNENFKVTKILNKNGINYKNFKSQIIKVIGLGKQESPWYLYTPLLRRIIEDAIIISKENNEDEVMLEHLFCALVDEGEGVAIRIILSMNIKLDKIVKELLLKSNNRKVKTNKKALIEEFGYNMNEKAQCNQIDPVIGRDKEIDRIIEILCRRTKNNPLLIGEAGVGKTAIVEELSRRIVEENIPEQLKNKKIISISVASLLAGTKYRGEFEERINKILAEIEENPEIILFIDEIHTLVGAGGAEGAIDASNILKPFLARGKLKLIGATTTEEYKTYLENDRALERRFQTLIIEEPDKMQTLKILKNIKTIYECYHNVKIPDALLEDLVELTNKYVYNRKQPDKAIDILDEACCRMALLKDTRTKNIEMLKKSLKKLNLEKNASIMRQDFKKAANIKEEENNLESKINELELKTKSLSDKKKLTLEVVAQVIKSKTQIPIYEVINEDLKELNKIEKKLSSKVIGQEEIISEISKDIKRIKLGYKDTQKPRSYLFVGPTGVGKTLLAKELNKIITGKDNLIRIDMSEYKEEHSISKIIGSPPGYVGYTTKTTILEQVKMKPNSIILIDEIEKGHPSVINLFLQVLDEGKMKNSNNEEIRFDNNIIIMTSNIGYNKSHVGFNENPKENTMVELRKILGIEMLNRINQTFIFKPLMKKDIKKIVALELNKLRKRFEIDSDKLYISTKVIDLIIEDSKYEDFGARRIENVIKNKVYDIVIEELMKKSVKITIETI